MHFMRGQTPFIFTEALYSNPLTDQNNECGKLMSQPSFHWEMFNEK